LAAGTLALPAADGRQAEAILGECVSLFRQLGQTRRVAEGLSYLGVAAMMQGEHDRSESLCREGLRICAELGQGR
jgi:hypothetical protein